MNILKKDKIKHRWVFNSFLLELTFWLLSERSFENPSKSAFGNFVPDVRRQILDANRAGKWHGAVPIGPVGDHMKPLKKEYLGVCEWLLKKPLNTYLYFDDNDKHLLQKILQKNCNSTEYRNIQLVKMRYNEEPISENPNFERQKVKVRGHFTVHDCFKYAHTMVERYLCEWNSIHTAGLQIDTG